MPSNYPMTEIEQEHQQLQQDFIRKPLPGERGAFWWLGQHTFILRAANLLFIFDPWLAPWETRRTKALLTPSELTSFDFALISHGHGDHLCPLTLTEMKNASPNALFICPATEKQRLLKEADIPEERIRTLNAGQTLEERGARITALKSKHEFFDEQPGLGFPYLGYVVEADGLTVYHSGDSIMYEGLLTSLQQWDRIDVMFLPINGRDAERYRTGVMGNFTYQEAAELAGELNTGLVVPSHYDMFEGNLEDPTKFADFLKEKYPSTAYYIGPAGKRISLK